MGLVLVVYVIRNTCSAWQTFSSKMPLWFETMLVRRAYQSVVQISKSRSAEQNSCWTPDILIMHFSWFYLDLSELVQCGESLVLLGESWMHCWRISSSWYIQFVYLDTATWSKHEGSRGYNSVQFKSFSSELKQEHRYALQWEIRTGKKPLSTCCSQDVLLCITLSHFGVRAAALVTCVAWVMRGGSRRFCC